MDETLKMLKELTDASGVPGFEREVREVIRKYVEPYAKVETDHLGSIVAKKQGTSSSPRIMLSGHMDEIGFMVKYITEKGFIKFTPLGGWFDQVLLAQRVIVKTRKGDIPGVIGSKPPHILDPEARKKVVERKDMFIDIGASSAEEAKEWGVRPGDPIVPVSEFTVMKNPDLLMAKAWDDRLGCAFFIDVIKALANADHPNTVYGVGTVQEEVGLRGAKTSAHLVDPDICFALEVGIAGDVPGVEKTEAQEELGKGPVILVYDRTLIPNARLRDLVVDTAEENGIPYQFDAMEGGGTDAGMVHLHEEGVPSLVIGVPTRYIHSHAGIINRKDYENAVKLMTAVIRKLDKDTVDWIRS